MRSVLRGLYEGKIYPNEVIVPKDPEYWPVCEKIEEETMYFKKKLSEEDCRRLDEWNNLYCQTDSMDSEASFLYGFKLAVLLMTEVFTDSEELMR